MSNSRSFFNEHFGAIITAVVALSAVLVSVAQIWVATINKEKEIESSRATAAESRSLDELKSSRIWKLDLAKFMAEHREAIFSKGQDGKQLQKVMLATFPPEITLSVFSSLSIISEKGTNNYWSSAKQDANLLHTQRVKIYYEKSFPQEIIGNVSDTLAEGEFAYNYRDQEIPKGLTDGDVRYFHPSDEKLAYTIKNDFEDMACFSGYAIRLKVIPFTSSKKRAPNGTVEVWLPGKAIIGKTVQEEC